MASLYIKDPVTAALATDIAARLGTTKTEAVSRALRCLDVPPAGPAPAAEGSTADWLRRHRATFPLSDREALKVDKAFYDSLSDEEDVFDPWSV